MTAAPHRPDSVDAVLAALAAENYVADRRLATSVFLALKLGRPLFVEGEPGVGKTELAKALARALADAAAARAVLRRASTSRRPRTSGTSRAR